MITGLSETVKDFGVAWLVRKPRVAVTVDPF
jgi:hypothetical protein